MYVQSNILARSCNYCCNGNNIAFCVCVCLCRFAESYCQLYKNNTQLHNNAFVENLCRR